MLNLDRLETLSKRFDEIEAGLGGLGRRLRSGALHRAYAKSAPRSRRRSKRTAHYTPRATEIASNDALLADRSDPELHALAEEEARALRERLRGELEARLQELMLPRDPNDDKDVFIEIRAGAGGDEAAHFRRRTRAHVHALRRDEARCKVELVSRKREREPAATKRSCSRCKGGEPYRQFKHETGVHRVQRVPVTEAQAACTRARRPSPCCRRSTRTVDDRDRFRKIWKSTRSRRQRRGRPARQQDRVGDSHHAQAERHHRRVQRGALAAAKPRARDGDAARVLLDRKRREAEEAMGRCAAARSAPATAPRRFAPTTSRRTASPTTASTRISATSAAFWTATWTASSPCCNVTNARGCWPAEGPTGPTKTVAAAVRRATAALRANSPSASADAALIVAAVTGRERSWLLAHGERSARTQSARTDRSLCAYNARAASLWRTCSGRRGFTGARFSVDARVLVPRPETEHLVEDALAELRAAQQAAQRLRVCDVGTGSGAIALTLAAEEPHLDVVRLRLQCRCARACAQQRVALGLAERVRFVAGDLANRCGPLPRSIACVANLPYVPTAEIPRVPDPVGFEPRVAVDGGADGLVLYRRLVRELPMLLAPEATAFFEAAPGTRRGSGRARCARISRGARRDRRRLRGAGALRCGRPARRRGEQASHGRRPE